MSFLMRTSEQYILLSAQSPTGPVPAYSPAYPPRAGSMTGSLYSNGGNTNRQPKVKSALLWGQIFLLWNPGNHNKENHGIRNKKFSQWISGSCVVDQRYLTQKFWSLDLTLFAKNKSGSVWNRINFFFIYFLFLIFFLEKLRN